MKLTSRLSGTSELRATPRTIWVVCSTNRVTLRSSMVIYISQYQNNMEVKTWVSIIKWINICAALLIGSLGIYELVTFQAFKNFDFLQIWSIFTPVYLMYGVFCMMLLALEFKGEFIAEWFQFMMSFIGRGVFYIFLGSVAAYQPQAYGAGKTAAWVWGFVLWLVGLFFVVLNCLNSGNLPEVKTAFQEKYGTTA